MHVLLHHFVYPYTDEDTLAAMLATVAEHRRTWRADGVKFRLDGVIDTGTAWLEEPDSVGEGRQPMWPDLKVFRARHARFHAARSRIATHAIGDRAVRETLDSWAALPSGSAGRHRTEHLETLPDATLARPGPELATASMQPVHLRWLAPDLTDPWSARLDLPRCVYAWRFGDVADSGALVVLGSDWPVAPSDPRFGFYAARTRHAHDVEPGAYGSSRPLTGEEMLAGYTRNPALAVGADAAVVAQGRPADLVIRGGDPVTVGVAELPELPVMVTVVDGRVVHRTL